MMRRERERGRERNANGQLSGRPCGQVVYTRGLCVGCYISTVRMGEGFGSLKRWCWPESLACDEIIFGGMSKITTTLIMVPLWTVAKTPVLTLLFNSHVPHRTQVRSSLMSDRYGRTYPCGIMQQGDATAPECVEK